MDDSHVEVTEVIAADAATLYEMVADLPGMGRWSPENVGGKWLGGATGPQVGARFRGSNRHTWRRWSTSVKVTEAVPGKRFAFHVSVGPFDVADWSYDFAETGGQTRVTETWVERRPGWMRELSKPAMGVPDRAGHNRRNMEATLTALKQGAEGGKGARSTATSG